MDCVERQSFLKIVGRMLEYSDLEGFRWGWICSGVVERSECDKRKQLERDSIRRFGREITENLRRAASEDSFREGLTWAEDFWRGTDAYAYEGWVQGFNAGLMCPDRVHPNRAQPNRAQRRAASRRKGRR